MDKYRFRQIIIKVIILFTILAIFRYNIFNKRFLIADLVGVIITSILIYAYFRFAVPELGKLGYKKFKLGLSGLLGICSVIIGLAITTLSTLLLILKDSIYIPVQLWITAGILLIIGFILIIYGYISKGKN